MKVIRSIRFGESAAMPMAVYRMIVKRIIVERLRESE